MESGKKLKSLFTALILAVACNGIQNPPDKPDYGPDTISDSKEIASFWKDSYAGEGFESVDDILYARYFKDGKYMQHPDAEFHGISDYRYEFTGKNGKTRHVEVADGYAITLPKGMKADHSIAKYGMKFKTDTSCLRITNERVTPYSPDERGYEIYITEWLDRYISNNSYLTQNGLKYEIATVKKNTAINEGYEVTIYSIGINKGEKAIALPHYRIAIVRKLGQYSSFGLLLYKSAEKDDGTFTDIVASYTNLPRLGVSKNYISRQQAKPDPGWNQETKAYYQKLINQNTLDFGVFSGSMPDDNDGSYEAQHQLISSEKERLEGPEGINHTYEIMPTYTHLAWYSTKMFFPVSMAAEFAGGNGFNGKPVLQFTYQFTTNNNYVSLENRSQNPTPMFDILRGRHDLHLRQLARDIKAYGKPVLFRLNNEMNSDWTSYCGLITLVDPDIFIDTWRYLYNLFREEGVDNCIWIFNPIAISCPYSFWGEDLAYYPGNDYVQALGLTAYEFNNGSRPESFRSMYSKLYDKNSEVFGDLPAIISEFACGSGGETTGELKRNKASQAQWVREMFDDLCKRQENPYIANIKGAVWFSCNDYYGDLITNCLKLDSDLTETLEAFRDGFSRLK